MHGYVLEAHEPGVLSSSLTESSAWMNAAVSNSSENTEATLILPPSYLITMSYRCIQVNRNESDIGTRRCLRAPDRPCYSSAA